ncbi:MAG: peroxidase-related enzyme [Robiginitomaculum sp.]|nr:peroxidase-related enzyme [Robiginitomaculum sp.]MDQ7076406.1 peroxidase-related enzyme [Robiginitomaculum sp.]
MSVYPSLKDPAYLEDLFVRFPRGTGPLMAFHDAVLRNEDSPLSIAEREIIAALVSGLNACAFCYGAHKTMAMAFGLPEETITALVEDIDSAPIDEKLKPLLHYVRKLTLSPSKMVQSDADAVFAAGWPEEALHDAVLVCALFNFMNRVLDGAGITPKPVFDQPDNDALKARRNSTYTGWARRAGIIS